MDENHRVWQALEVHFNTRFYAEEKLKMTQIMKTLVNLHPELSPQELTESTLQVAQRVLEERR